MTGSVDGVESEALSVMSQGELHALALALFIPRATTPNSPFRFIVLDDPIQAMDPAKIDGFIRCCRRSRRPGRSSCSHTTTDWPLRSGNSQSTRDWWK